MITRLLARIRAYLHALARLHRLMYMWDSDGKLSYLECWDCDKPYFYDSADDDLFD